MTGDPVIAIAATPRGWAQRLHAHVADHGGARVRVTVLHPDDALAEEHRVLLVDDITSFLTPALVAELQRRGRAVLGVYDPDDERGKGVLVECGVDALAPADADPAELLHTVRELAARLATAGPTTAPAPRAPSRAGAILAVGGPPGGVGATEIAIELAAVLSERGLRVALVDGDDHAPSLAQRLALPVHPNLRTAAEAVERRAGRLGEALVALSRRRCLVALPGLVSGRDWAHLRPGAVIGCLTALAADHDVVVTNVGACLDDLDTLTGGRYTQTREQLAGADHVVVAAHPTPTGIARAIDWIAGLADLPAPLPVTVALNHAPPGRFERGEATAELLATGSVAAVHAIPRDPRVTAASWSGHRVAAGPFAKAVAQLADRVGAVLGR